MAGTYVHGSSEREQARLSLMNDIINPPCLKELDLGGERRVLDVGSGTGLFSRDIARTLGSSSRVVGVEGDEKQLARARALASSDSEETLVDFRQGDALSLPLRGDENGMFDLAHTRFLLEHVRDPLGVVRGLVDAVRPGGRVILADDDHEIFRIWPEVPSILGAWKAYYQSYQQFGNDPYVGRRLVSLLHQSGAIPKKNSLVFYGGCSGSPQFTGILDNLAEVLEGARAAVLSGSLTTAREYDLGIEETRSFAERPDAAVWYAIHWAEGIRPESPTNLRN